MFQNLLSVQLLLITGSFLSYSDGKLLFNGDASLGSNKVWKQINLEGKGTSVDVVTDSKLKTKVWRFTKPSGAKRSEGHGSKNFQAKEGDDLYIGWSLNLNLDPPDLKTFANFQWKSYPTEGSLQNHPVMLRTIKGKLELEQFNPDKKNSKLWSSDFKNNTWYSVVLRIKVSKDIKKGFVEFWFQGKQVTFANNGKSRFYCRTFDADFVDPKWGVYGGETGSGVNKVGDIKIATSLAEAMPSRSRVSG